jgi:hypothetical protein
MLCDIEVQDTPTVVTEQWREGGYVIDFKVGQSFGEPQRPGQ